MNKPPTKWWLICDEDVEKIRKGLEAAVEDCEEMHGGMDAGWYRSQLHTLDSGLHTTDAVPADFCDAQSAGQIEAQKLRGLIGKDCLYGNVPFCECGFFQRHLDKIKEVHP